MTDSEFYGWLLVGVSFGFLCVTMFGLALVWRSLPPRR